MKKTNLSKEQVLFLRNERKKRFEVIFFRILILIVLLAIWELSAQCGKIDTFFFSSPSLCIKTFRKMLLNQNLFHHIKVTLLEILVSFLLVNSLSLILALLFWYYSSLSRLLEPYLILLNSLPKSALAPLLIVWLGTGSKTIIVAGISVAIFGSILSLYTAFLQTDPGKIRVIHALGGRRYHALFKVILPANLPQILGNMKVNIGLALVGVIIGEFLAARHGLGYLIIYGSQTFKMSMVITSLILLCLIAVALYLLLELFEKKALKRRHKAN